MKTFFALLVALAFPIAASADAWKENVTLYVNGKNLQFFTPEQSDKTVGRVMLSNTGRIDLKLTPKTLPDKTSIVVTQIKGSTVIYGPIELTSNGREEATIHAVPSGDQGSDRDIDTILKVARKTGDVTSTSDTNTLHIVVARRTALFGTLSAGAIYTAQSRKRYTLAGAFDASGNAIPNRSIIIEERNDAAITSTISGKYYYVFGEQQDSPLIRFLQRAFSLSLYREGETRFGLFLGIAEAGAQSPEYQLGITFFPDRGMNLAFSLGANFAQGETLTSGFKAGDIVSLSNLSNVTRRGLTPGFFFSITFNAASVGK